jgi:SAM-dependent methyltransferase
MPTDHNALYASAQVRQLFAQELAALTPILGGVYGNAGLLLRAHADTAAELPKHLVGTILDLALTPRRALDGSLRCLPDELPLLSGSCKLVIAQHVLERLDDPAAAIGELARVLAPEGVALILGFNPWSLWRPWLAGKSRGAATSLYPRSALSCQHLLAKHGIETLQTRYLGASMPLRRETPQTVIPEWRSPLLGRFAAGWLLLARKRRSALTPLRLRSKARELAINPRLATGAHRECA